MERDWECESYKNCIEFNGRKTGRSTVLNIVDLTRLDYERVLIIIARAVRRRETSCDITTDFPFVLLELKVRGYKVRTDDDKNAHVWWSAAEQAMRETNDEVFITSMKMLDKMEEAGSR